MFPFKTKATGIDIKAKQSEENLKLQKEKSRDSLIVAKQTISDYQYMISSLKPFFDMTPLLGTWGVEKRLRRHDTIATLSPDFIPGYKLCLVIDGDTGNVIGVSNAEDTISEEE